MIEFDQVSKAYGPKQVLDDLSFTVQPGEMFGFCGANGAGKTTTMRIVLGLVRRDSGSVRWQGQEVDLDVRRRFGYMPEERGLYPKMRAVEQLTYFAMLATGVAVVQQRPRVLGVVGLVELEDLG